MRATEDVQTEGDGEIVGQALPSASDFRELREHWRIVPDDSGTRVHYAATMMPKFFVPPLIGPWLIKATLRRELATSARRIERLSHE